MCKEERDSIGECEVGLIVIVDDAVLEFVNKGEVMIAGETVSKEKLPF